MKNINSPLTSKVIFRLAIALGCAALIVGTASAESLDLKVFPGSPLASFKNVTFQGAYGAKPAAAIAAPQKKAQPARTRRVKKRGLRIPGTKIKVVFADPFAQAAAKASGYRWTPVSLPAAAPKSNIVISANSHSSAIGKSSL